jgi:hypothetical protein
MNREDWLKLAEQKMVAWIVALSYAYPENTRISCGFPKSSKGRNNAIGQCWSSAASADRTHEIFISPTQADKARVCDILLHEMVHATVGIEAGHGKPFTTLARALGLEGKPTATFAGEALKARIDGMLETLPDYPHATITPSVQTTKKQKTALLRCECPQCGYLARVTAKWVDSVGAPICPACDVTMNCDGAGPGEPGDGDE